MFFSLRFFRPNGEAQGKAILEVHRGGSKDKQASVPLQQHQADIDDVDRSALAFNDSFHHDLFISGHVYITQIRPQA